MLLVLKVALHEGFRRNRRILGLQRVFCNEPVIVRHCEKHISSRIAATKDLFGPRSVERVNLSGGEPSGEILSSLLDEP